MFGRIIIRLFETADLLGLLVQLEIVQDDGDEERHDDEGDEEVVKDEVHRHDHGQAGINLNREEKLCYILVPIDKLFHYFMQNKDKKRVL